MDQSKLLQERSRVLRALLEHYAKSDDDARMVLEFMTALFKDIESGKVNPPVRDRYRWYFANTEGPLFKYDDLGEAHAKYSHALEGRTTNHQGLD